MEVLESYCPEADYCDQIFFSGADLCKTKSHLHGKKTLDAECSFAKTICEFIGHSVSQMQNYEKLFEEKALLLLAAMEWFHTASMCTCQNSY